jgi:uncharacterized repeat protein (TIGR01451 family)
LSVASLAAALSGGTAALAGPGVVINEIDCDQVGTDMGEFVELYDGGAGSTDLTGLVVVFYNGSGDVSYAAFDLDGFSTDAGGFFVLGNATVPGVDMVFADNFLQNGADAVALYSGNASSFPNGTAVTATGLLDAVVYDTADADDAGLIAVLGGPQIDEGANGDAATDSVGRSPDFDGAFTTIDTPTPGVVNTPGVVILAVTKTAPLYAEEGSQITYAIMVTNSGTVSAADVVITDTLPAGALFVSETSSEEVILDDSGEPTIVWSTDEVAGLSSLEILLTVTLPAGAGDLKNAVEVTTTSDDDPGDNSASATTTVVAVGAVVINEILADPPAAGGDANGDGSINAGEDEFIEIVNNSEDALDLSGWTLSDEVAVRHTFPEGTVVPGDCAILVFGGGVPTGGFGDTVVQVASGGFLGFNNGGDSAVLHDAGAILVTAASYGAEGGMDQSLVRDPDVTGAAPLVQISTASGFTGAVFTPGTTTGGQPFTGCGKIMPCLGDVTGDGMVDVQDMVQVILDWNCMGVCEGDANGDMVVDVQDLVDVVLGFGPCP